MLNSIKVLLSSRPKLLSEVIKNLIAHQPDMQMVGEVLDPLQLLRVVRETSVDVIIITPLKANGEPRICHQLLVEHPRLIIVTQSAEGTAAHLYRADALKLRIDKPSSLSILDAIRKARSVIVNL
jgi:DNA-binding NarL/FixJ family response regulator